jgi:AraC-like DNA-binding protein
MVILDQAGRGRPWLRIVPAPPDVRDLVEHFWIEDSRGINTAHRGAWRIVPDGSAHLIFGTVEDECTVRYRLSVVGARTVQTDIDRAGRVVTVGARLVPGALPSLVREDARHFADFGTPLLDLSPRLGRDALERLTGAEDHADLWRGLAALVARMRRGAVLRQVTPIMNAVRLIDTSGGNADIHRVAYEVGMAPRTFRATFAEQVGLAPKRYARIRRLHEAMHLTVGGSTRSLAGIASRTGYADQAHMTRDFRALVGEPPGAYLDRRVVS